MFTSRFLFLPPSLYAHYSTGLPYLPARQQKRNDYDTIFNFGCRMRNSLLELKVSILFVFKIIHCGNDGMLRPNRRTWNLIFSDYCFLCRLECLEFFCVSLIFPYRTSTGNKPFSTMYCPKGFPFSLQLQGISVPVPI